MATSQLSEPEVAARAISWRSILRGAVTRFAGGIGAFLAGSFVFAASLKPITIGPHQVFGFSELVLGLTVGYVIMLGLVRPTLDPAADVEGRRSVVAGLGATCVYLYMGVLHDGPTPHLLRVAFAVAAGGLTTLLLFSPWLSRAGRWAESTSPIPSHHSQSSTVGSPAPFTRRGEGGRRFGQ